MSNKYKNLTDTYKDYDDSFEDSKKRQNVYFSRLVINNNKAQTFDYEAVKYRNYDSYGEYNNDQKYKYSHLYLNIEKSIFNKQITSLDTDTVYKFKPDGDEFNCDFDIISHDSYRYLSIHNMYNATAEAEKFSCSGSMRFKNYDEASGTLIVLLRIKIKRLRKYSKINGKRGMEKTGTLRNNIIKLKAYTNIGRNLPNIIEQKILGL
jgi:hypothetical protein